jgi:hypothetical protein
VRNAAVVIVLGCALGALAGCLSERPRPAPPRLAIVLGAKLVHSPDTLRGTIHADDPDGIDSVWLAVGTAQRLGDDAFLETVFEEPFVVTIAQGLSPGDRIPVKVTARDVVGFTGELDTVVTVAQ